MNGDYLKVHLDVSNYEQFQWLRTFIFLETCNLNKQMVDGMEKILN